LVSVRSAAEAELALAGGADLIDVKEPRRGALGPADARVWREVLRAVAGRVPVSAALGELLDDGICERAADAAGLRFAKFGLAGCHSRRGWLGQWRQALRALPRGVAPVPVAYADWPAADAPSPAVAMALAQQSLARILLIDTYDKSRGTLLDVLSWEALCEIAAHARQAGVRLVLAGSLDAAALRRVLGLAPAWVGVRGAACRGGREGTIETALVKSLTEIVMEGNRKAAG
jgi:uncharacterized protein (UPF0264 family)